MARVYNFSAGPSVLPESVLRRAAEEMLDYQGSGQSVMEMSHRSKTYDAIIKECEATYTYQNAINTRKLLDERGIEVKRALLCCQAYHARRSKLYYQILFPDTEILVVPTITKGITRDNWFKSREKSDIVLGEIERCGSQFHEIVAEYGALEE